MKRDDVPVARREPELRDDERSGEDARRDETGPPGNERNKRHEPDEELRREHLPERDERGDGRCRGDDEPLPLGRVTSEEKPDSGEGHRLDDRLGRRNRLGQRAGEILRAVTRDDHGVVEPELVAGEKDARTEALDLERPAYLALEALEETVGCDEREREKGGRENEGEDGKRDEGLAPSSPARDVDEREREEDERVDLGGDPRGKEAEGNAIAAGEERDEPADRERGRPEVEAGEDHRAKEKRRERGERDRGAQATRGGFERGERGRDERDGGCPAEEHES